MTDKGRDETVERDLGLAPAFDEERIAATWQRVVQTRTGGSSLRGRLFVPAMVLAAAAVLAVVVVTQLGDRPAPAPGPLASRDRATTVEVGAVVEPGPVATHGRALVLDDGSRVDLEGAARLQVLANDGARFVTLLDRGGAHFDVTPGGPRRWTIETALATVEVVGTAFRLEPGPHRLVVEVERGVVVVSGDRVPGRVVRLTAGDRLEVTDEAEAVAPTPTSVSVSVSVSDPVPLPVPLPVPDSPRVRAVSPPPPPAPAVVEPPTVPSDPSMHDSLTAADHLRASGHASEAAALLDRALARYPDDPAAGLAAFTLGRICLDVLADPSRASAAFARVIALGSPSSLLEDAHARRADALLRAKRLDDAADAILSYEKAYPKGRRAAALRARLDAAQ